MIRVVCGVLRRGDKVYAQQRLPRDAGYPLHWEFPGGAAEPGEHDDEALIREFWEELGVLVVPGAFITSTTFDVEHGHFELVLYEVASALPETAAIACHEAVHGGFYLPSEVPTPWVPSMAHFLRAIRGLT